MPKPVARTARPLPRNDTLLVGLRLAGDHERLRQAARRLGLAYLALSPLRVVRLDDWPVSSLAADLRIFTSPAAVRAVLARGVPLQVNRPALVVGARSAALLSQAGLRHVHVAQQPDIASLLCHPMLDTKPLRRVTVFTAPEGRGDWQVLRRRGFDVEVVPVYRREPTPLRAASLDVLRAAPRTLAVASSEALLRAALAALPSASARQLRAGGIVVSSPRLADIAHDLGISRVWQAEGPSPSALAAVAARAVAD